MIFSDVAGIGLVRPQMVGSHFRAHPFRPAVSAKGLPSVQLTQIGLSERL